MKLIFVLVAVSFRTCLAWLFRSKHNYQQIQQQAKLSWSPQWPVKWPVLPTRLIPRIRSSCPKEKTFKLRTRSTRSLKKTIASYSIVQNPHKQLLAIGKKVSRAGAFRLASITGKSASEYEGKVCVGGKCYRPKEKNDKEKCYGVDLTFIMDCSGSIDSTEWKQLTKFVKDTASIFDVHIDSTRVAAINFGSQACLQFNFGTHHTNEKFYRGIDKVPKCGGATHLADALDIAREKVSNSMNDRPHVLNLCMVFTDGEANGRPKYVAKAAKKLRESGCETYAIGIGNGVNKDQLRNVAGSAGKVILAKDFNDLIENRIFCGNEDNFVND